MDKKRYFDRNGQEKHKYTVSITRTTDDGYGNRTSTVIKEDTWAISAKKAISNVRYRTNKTLSYSEYQNGPAFFDTYSAELAG